MYPWFSVFASPIGVFSLLMMLSGVFRLVDRSMPFAARAWLGLSRLVAVSLAVAFYFAMAPILPKAYVSGSPVAFLAFAPYVLLIAGEAIGRIKCDRILAAQPSFRLRPIASNDGEESKN